MTLPSPLFRSRKSSRFSFVSQNQREPRKESRFQEHRTHGFPQRIVDNLQTNATHSYFALLNEWRVQIEKCPVLVFLKPPTQTFFWHIRKDCVRVTSLKSVCALEASVLEDCQKKTLVRRLNGRRTALGAWAAERYT